MRTVETKTEEEFIAIAHLREWCHDSSKCPLCRAFLAGHSEAIRRIAEG